jgi:hypothetical protein
MLENNLISEVCLITGGIADPPSCCNSISYRNSFPLHRFAISCNFEEMGFL